MKRIHFFSMLFLLFCIGIFAYSCKHEIPNVATNGGGSGGGGGNGGGGGGTGGGGGGAAPCDSNKVYFQQQVLPILLSNCAMSGCHDAASHQDGVILTSYQSVMATADVRPGRPFNSDLYESIVETDLRKRMPPSPNLALTDDQKALIYNWILQGAQDLVCQELCDASNFTFSGAVQNIMTNKCQGCHSGTTPAGGIDLSTYAGIKAKVDDGKLWGAINHAPGFSPMPKNGNKLSDCEIQQIENWIAAGALNN